MENENVRSGENENSAFGEQARQETETVFRRAGGESLDDYLRNVTVYLDDLNRRLGVGAAQPQAEEPPPEEIAAEESSLPPREPSLPPEDIPFAQAFAEEPSPYPDFPAPGAPTYGVPSGAFYPEPERGGVHDWREAVHRPELYPDLNDPRVTGRRDRRKRAAEQNEPFPAEKRSRKRRRQKSAPSAEKGDVSRFAFVVTVGNLGLYAGWMIAYFISLAVRSMMFTSAQAEMAMQGVAAYSVTITSPLFTALKILIYAMPAVLLLWIWGVLSADKKGLEPPDRKWLIAAFAADLAVGGVVIFDVLAAKLVFGV